MQQARRIIEEQKLVLDKLRYVYGFFGGLEVACGAVEDVRKLSVCAL